MPFSSRLWVSLLLLVAAVFVILFLDLWSWAWLAVLLLWMSFAGLFGLGWAALLLGLGLLANWGLGQANAYKIALSSMPITMLDLRIVSGDSALLWYVLNWPQWTRWLFIVVLLCLLAYVAYQAVLRAWTSSSRAVAGVAIWSVALLCVLGLLDEKLTLDLKRHLTVLSTQEGGLVEVVEVRVPGDVARVASRVGVIPFLLYSARLERESGSLLFDGGGDAEPAHNSDVLKAAGRFFSPEQGRRSNIVLVQLESIFNPNWAFELDGRVGSFLFEPNEFSHYLLPMRVNIIGGGSWISEFEAVTGLDYRLFGYSGYYTHATVSAYIEGGFPAYLRKKGYRTNVFYTDGHFYNARRAFKRYGFEYFSDYRTLELGDGWSVQDTEMAGAFVQQSHSFGTDPFFSFIDTNGAHSPYPCTHFKMPEDFLITFKGSADFRMNCELNEYVRLAQNSASAIQAILDRLREIETKTGRPFVLMFYGDHQPHSFTKMLRSEAADYESVRTDAGRSQTFVHVMSSLPRSGRHIDREIPVTLLPTILSSFVADVPDDLYMVANLYLFEACGSDLYRWTPSKQVFGIGAGVNLPVSGAAVAGEPSAVASEACELAQKRTVALLRGPSGILKAGRLQPR